MDTFGKNDVYVELKTSNSNTFTTTIKEDAGDSANFNEKFEMY